MHLSVEIKSSQKFSYGYIKHIIIIKMMIEVLQSAYSSDLEIKVIRMCYMLCISEFYVLASYINLQFATD